MNTQERMNNFLGKIATFFNTQPHISAIKDGIVTVTPFTIIGGIALVIANPPIPENMEGAALAFPL